MEHVVVFFSLFSEYRGVTELPAISCPTVDGAVVTAAIYDNDFHNARAVLHDAAMGHTPSTLCAPFSVSRLCVTGAKGIRERYIWETTMLCREPLL